MSGIWVGFREMTFVGEGARATLALKSLNITLLRFFPASVA